PIPNSDLSGLNLEGLNSYYLHLNPTHRNAIFSIEQLEAYKKQFRNLLDKINQSYPKLKRIHLFYSGQPSLAYRLGSAITQRMDKEIIVYNYVGTSYPKYNWAINLKKVEQPITVNITGDELSGNVRP
ncbi:SAVED domain-containing protein, partial [Aeromonas veronii]|nr:SAVED domain-containing protein [Aeromonas veronii]